MSCEVYLIRHGQTNWNVEGKLQGHTDEPLNEDGESQAHALKAKLEGVSFDAVFSSDLSRASKTAEIIIGSQDIVKDPALRERCMGAWEGHLTKDLKTWFNEQGICLDNLSKEEYVAYKWQSDIESYSEVYKRLSNFITTQATSRIGSKILISSHGGVLRSLLYHLDFQAGFRWQVSNCAYIRLLVNEAGQISIAETDGAKSTKEASITF